MTPQQVVEVIRQALWMAFWLSLPLLAIGFLSGIVISLVQIVTSIQDSSFSAVPRLVAFLAGLIVLLPWMLAKMLGYTIGLLGNFAQYAR